MFRQLEVCKDNGLRAHTLFAMEVEAIPAQI